MGRKYPASTQTLACILIDSETYWPKLTGLKTTIRHRREGTRTGCIVGVPHTLGVFGNNLYQWCYHQAKVKRDCLFNRLCKKIRLRAGVWLSGLNTNAAVRNLTWLLYVVYFRLSITNKPAITNKPNWVYTTVRKGSLTGHWVGVRWLAEMLGFRAH